MSGSNAPQQFAARVQKLFDAHKKKGIDIEISNRFIYFAAVFESKLRKVITFQKSFEAFFCRILRTDASVQLFLHTIVFDNFNAFKKN